MFRSWGAAAGFLVGVLLTVGLLLTPHLVPGGWGYRTGLAWSAVTILAVALAGLGLLALVLWLAGRWIRGAASWREPRVIVSAVVIALTGNTLFMFMVEWFALNRGWRALIAVLGVPVIYGNLAAVLGQRPLQQAMADIFTGGLATMGAGFIAAALLTGWH